MSHRGRSLPCMGKSNAKVEEGSTKSYLLGTWVPENPDQGGQGGVARPILMTSHCHVRGLVEIMV